MNYFILYSFLIRRDDGSFVRDFKIYQSTEPYISSVDLAIEFESKFTKVSSFVDRTFTDFEYSNYHIVDVFGLYSLLIHDNLF